MLTRREKIETIITRESVLNFWTNASKPNFNPLRNRFVHRLAYEQSSDEELNILLDKDRG